MTTSRAIERADHIIREIIALLNATDIDPDVQAALEIELLTLRIQVEIIRKAHAMTQQPKGAGTIGYQ